MNNRFNILCTWWISADVIDDLRYQFEPSEAYGRQWQRQASTWTNDFFLQIDSRNKI